MYGVILRIDYSVNDGVTACEFLLVCTYIFLLAFVKITLSISDAIGILQSC